MNNYIQHIFIIGAKSIGQYGGYETFVDKLTEQHQKEQKIKYHVACKANGDGCLDERNLPEITVLKKDRYGNTCELEYHNAHIFKIKCPNIGPAVAVYYDFAALCYCINYCRKKQIKKPVFYILACRIGLFINFFAKKIKSLNGVYYLNPDGHEWKRKKWSAPIRRYWKWSEGQMVKCADLIVCDSVHIERYIKKEYHHPHTAYIAYGADVVKSSISDNDPTFLEWMNKNKLVANNYYLVVGRFVPENNYEIMIREFMDSKSKKDFAIITNVNQVFLDKLESSLHFKADHRIKFVGTVYNQDLLKKIRENAYGYFHGHEVGGTNPSLLEAMGSTKLNLLLDVGFNREVGQDAALYWTKERGVLRELINRADKMPEELREEYGIKARQRIESSYSWEFIGNQYNTLWEAETKRLRANN